MSWDLLGHEWAVELLQDHVAQGRLRHAYLITGPQGSGRRTLALRLAQAINCQQPPAPGEACGECRACRLIERMQHPDLTILQAENEGGVLKVEQIRELQRGLSLAPYEARYRVALLLRFEEANLSASNALLKTLEEPPAQVILILTASSTEALLPTIVSRCETIRLRPLAVEQVAGGLQQRWSLPEEEASLLAHISGGRPGAALRLHSEPERLEHRLAWLEELYKLLQSPRVERFSYIDSIYKDKEAARQACQVWLSFWRDVLLVAAGSSAPLGNPDQAGKIAELAQVYGLRAARDAVHALERTLDLMDKNINLRLALEVLALDLPGL